MPFEGTWRARLLLKSFFAQIRRTFFQQEHADSPYKRRVSLVTSFTPVFLRYPSHKGRLGPFNANAGAFSRALSSLSPLVH
jgi:hypothetical protein